MARAEPDERRFGGWCGAGELPALGFADADGDQVVAGLAGAGRVVPAVMRRPDASA